MEDFWTVLMATISRAARIQGVPPVGTLECVDGFVGFVPDTITFYGSPVVTCGTEADGSDR